MQVSLSNATCERDIELFSENTLVKTDRFGTKWYSVTKIGKCGRCMGRGYLPAYVPVNGGTCFQCQGSGTEEFHYQYKEYTKSRLASLMKQREARNADKVAREDAQTKAHYGLSGSTARLVVGYTDKSTMKSLGAHFKSYGNLGAWVLPTDAKSFSSDKTTTVELPMNEFLHGDVDAKVASAITALETLKAEKTEYYDAKVGEKIEVTVRFTKKAYYETQFGITNVLTFEDNANHAFVWKTATFPACEIGDTVTIKGTVKDFGEYKGAKQTSLVRVKVQR